MDKENIELAEEHIKLANELIVKEAQSADKDQKEKIIDAGFSLEKAQANIDELNGKECVEQEKISAKNPKNRKK